MHQSSPAQYSWSSSVPTSGSRCHHCWPWLPGSCCCCCCTFLRWVVWSIVTGTVGGTHWKQANWVSTFHVNRKTPIKSVVTLRKKHTHSFYINLVSPVAGGDVGRLGPSVEVSARLVARCSSLGLGLALALLQHGALTLPHPGGQQGALRGCSPTGKAWHWVLVLLLLAHSCRLEWVKGYDNQGDNQTDTDV